MPKPVVSIIVTTKNYGRYLPAALKSILAQTVTDWETVVIDDGSTDGTHELIQPYLSDKLRYIRSDRLGQSRAKNLGISLTNSDYIAYLDADDIWQPNKLEKQLPLLENAHVGVVYSKRSLIDGEGQALPRKQQSTCHRGYILNEMFAQNFVCFSSSVVRRSLFDQVGRFDESLDLAIDYDLWLRAARFCEFDFVNEELVQYRTGHANLSRRLTDRVTIACAIMDKAVQRGGIRRSVIAEGYASTCRTLAYVLRNSNPKESLRWLAKAWRWPNGRLLTAKGTIATTLALFRKSVKA